MNGDPIHSTARDDDEDHAALLVVGLAVLLLMGFVFFLLYSGGVFGQGRLGIDELALSSAGATNGPGLGTDADSQPDGQATAPPPVEASVDEDAAMDEPTATAEDADEAGDGNAVVLADLVARDAPLVSEAFGPAGVTPLLSQPDGGQYTVFMPTDSAVGAAGLDPEGLNGAMRYHVVRGALTPEDLQDGDSLSTLQGEPIIVTREGDTVTLNGQVTVTGSDDSAVNGVVHSIDGVLVPPSLVPAIPADVTLAEAADGAGLSGLVAAAQAQGLTGVLSGSAAGPFTVFGPPDAALADVDPSAASTGQVLRFHVVVGALTAADLTDGRQLTTLQGEQLAVQRDGDTITLQPGDVAVTRSVTASNGVLHIIDGLLVPPSIASASEAAAAINDLLALEPILFATGSAEILAESRPTLEQAAQLLVGTEASLTIEGHTDADGAESTNLALSQARADAVAAALVDLGVDQDLLTAVGIGEAEPVAPNDTPENKQRNRRIEFVLS